MNIFPATESFLELMKSAGEEDWAREVLMRQLSSSPVSGPSVAQARMALHRTVSPVAAKLRHAMDLGRARASADKRSWEGAKRMAESAIASSGKGGKGDELLSRMRGAAERAKAPLSQVKDFFVRAGEDAERRANTRPFSAVVARLSRPMGRLGEYERPEGYTFGKGLRQFGAGLLVRPGQTLKDVGSEYRYAGQEVKGLFAKARKALEDAAS